MRHVWWVLLCVACAHNVAQDKATGPDGRQKGAKPLPIKDGEARDRGIVTYPGGDRIDWKLIELPEGHSGKLDIQLTWQPPRPGLQLAFDVFDQWNRPVIAVSASALRRGRMRSATIADAAGKYFVRIYAPRRGDAGAYKLRAQFEGRPPDDDDARLRARLAEIPDPPRLPAIPEVEPECTMFDPKLKACQKVCAFGAPPDWAPCKKLADEEAKRKAIEDEIKNRPPPPKPVTTRIIAARTVDNRSQVTLALGGDETKEPIDSTWIGEVLGKDSGKPLVGGRLVITRVGKTETLATSTLTIDQLTANPQVRLSPPSKP